MVGLIGGLLFPLDLLVAHILLVALLFTERTSCVLSGAIVGWVCVPTSLTRIMFLFSLICTIFGVLGRRRLFLRLVFLTLPDVSGVALRVLMLLEVSYQSLIQLILVKKFPQEVLGGLRDL